MNYEEFKKLTDEQQKEVPDEELPEIPSEQLENKLTYSKMIRQDGELGWKITQKVKNGENTRWFPVYMCKIVSGQEFWYKFDPICGLYSLNLVGLEPSIEEEPIGNYGMQWIDFMEKHYPHLVELMWFHHKFLTVARKVDENANRYRELLDNQYAKSYPRPDTDSFEELLEWEQTRAFYTDSTTVRERVLIPYTEDLLGETKQTEE